MSYMAAHVLTLCCAAFHASEGLALQILERQAEANTLFNTPGSPVTKETERVCANWDKWFGDCKNWWSGCDSAHVLYVPDFLLLYFEVRISRIVIASCLFTIKYDENC
jgi:hypothetical protein